MRQCAGTAIYVAPQVGDGPGCWKDDVANMGREEAAKAEMKQGRVAFSRNMVFHGWCCACWDEEWFAPVKGCCDMS